jgi:virginiamycin B lyase
MTRPAALLRALADSGLSGPNGTTASETSEAPNAIGLKGLIPRWDPGICSTSQVDAEIDCMRRAVFTIASCIAFVWGCASNTPSAIPTPGTKPLVLQTGQNPQEWTSLKVKSATTGPLADITFSSQKLSWFTDPTDSLVGRADLNKNVKTFALTGMTPTFVAIGQHQLIYFDQCTSQIATMTTSGITATYQIPSGSIACGALTEGPDHNIWFAEANHIAKIDTAGKIHEFKFTDAAANGLGIATGPDQALWFTEQGVNAIHKIVPSTHAITNYDLTPVGQCNPVGITKASDGNLWFGCSSAQLIGKITTSGTPTLIRTPFLVDGIKAMGEGPDGNPWFLNATTGAVAEIDATTGNIMINLSPYSSGAHAVTAGPDGNVWVAGDKQVTVFIRNIITVSPTSLTFSAPGQYNYIQGSETGNPQLTAVSSNPNVASLAGPWPQNIYAVNANSVGTCYVTMSDSLGNSFRVTVTVQ